MRVNVMAFGSLTDIIGTSFKVEDVSDTDALLRELANRYPQLKNSKYAVSVNKKMINSNTALDENDTVALMSPFSGG